MGQQFIDPEELPFTRDEVLAGARKFLPEDAAEGTAEALDSAGPGLIAARAERRAGWRAAGIPKADTLPLLGWSYPDELLPAIASLSDDAADRARRLVELGWERHRRGMIYRAQFAAGQKAGVIPSDEELARLARQATSAPENAVGIGDALAISLPDLPPITAEMIAVADAEIAERRAAWIAAVAKFRAMS